jgi:phosphatidylserine/phosphatidylglycerophosphate/cardiolipin synthase-like enzyme
MKKFILIIVTFFYLISLSLADSVRIIDNPEDAYQVRMHLLEGAQEEIQISYFIFAEDQTALEVLALLRKKAREGVKVKLMIDSMFNHIPKELGTHLQQENVQIRNFNNFNIFKFGKSIRYRMHDKMFIVDQQKIIMGGRNIEDTYFGKAKKNYEDRDLFMIGNIAKEASEYFDSLWSADHVKEMKRVDLKDDSAAKELDKVEENYFSKSSLTDFDLTSWESQLLQVENVHLFHDAVNAKKQKMTGTATQLYDLIKNAKKSVIIDSPYLIMTKELKAVFKDAIARNVKIRILTNSLKSTDGLLPQAGYIGQRKKIVQMGIDLYEYFADDSFHSKSMVVDDEIAAIGSFNFDPRSQNLNTETMAVVNNSKMAAMLTDSMNESLKLAYKINNKGRPEGFNSKLPGVSLKKKVVTRLIQYLVVPFTKGLL